MAYKKKLHLSPSGRTTAPIEAHLTKRRKGKRPADRQSIEREVREILARRVSGTLLGVWLLISEHLRLGSWELLTAWTKKDGESVEPRLALQLVHEAALCVTGVRQRRSLCHQGFEVANGLPFIATDEEIHRLLNAHTMREARELQIFLAQLRHSRGHYKGRWVAFDPHRIATYSRRIMPRKKSHPQKRAEAVLQSFFATDAETGQPFGCSLGSAGKTITTSAIELMGMLSRILPSEKMLLLADTEYENRRLLDHICASEQFDIIMPAARRQKVLTMIRDLSYQSHWAGYATGETSYKYQGGKYALRLIGQRTGEREYHYKPFIATGHDLPLGLLTTTYPKRWTIEEFFNFEGAMGWDRAATMNLNIRYGRLSLALIAQAATYQLRKKLPVPYRSWTAEHLSDSIFRGIDGDLRVKDDTILVTLYNVPERLNLRRHYENLPEKLSREGTDPRIPWLFNLKLDFRFK
ncbi:MAG: transposase [FCB group bacterium]|nr:transposase [FCB group bacterium]